MLSQVDCGGLRDLSVGMKVGVMNGFYTGMVSECPHQNADWRAAFNIVFGPARPESSGTPQHVSGFLIRDRIVKDKDLRRNRCAIRMGHERWSPASRLAQAAIFDRKWCLRFDAHGDLGKNFITGINTKGA